MKLLVNPTSYSNAIHLINLGVDQIFIGTNKYCTRNSCNLSINEIKDLAENKKSTEVIVSINKLFFENEIEDLTKYIIELSKININGIIFADYAVNQICFENDINIRLIYNPDTLVVNYAQFDFYLSNNIKEVSLAREINKKEILEIIANKKEMNTQLQVCGYAFMMHSRWNLLTNFKNSHNVSEELVNKKLYLKEAKRNNPFLIYEDEHGTYTFTEYNLLLLDKLQELYDAGLDTIRIDSFLHNEEWTNMVSEIFIDAIKLLKQNKFNDEFVDEKTKQIQNIVNGEIQSHGFYNSAPKDLIYLDTPDSIRSNNE